MVPLDPGIQDGDVDVDLRARPDFGYTIGQGSDSLDSRRNRLRVACNCRSVSMDLIRGLFAKAAMAGRQLGGKPV